MKPDSPLYLAVIKSPKTEVWYKRQPLGIHSLGQFMKTMADAVSLTGKRTNHSARRTMITGLRHEKVNPLDISQLSGHKNLKSIDSYSTVSAEQQKEVSLAISSHCGARPALNQLSLNSPVESSMATGTNASTACGNKLFSGAVFNNCTIVIGERSPQIPSKRRRIVIHVGDEWPCFELNSFTQKIVMKIRLFSKFSLVKTNFFSTFFLNRNLKLKHLH